MNLLEDMIPLMAIQALQHRASEAERRGRREIPLSVVEARALTSELLGRRKLADSDEAERQLRHVVQHKLEHAERMAEAEVKRRVDAEAECDQARRANDAMRIAYLEALAVASADSSKAAAATQKAEDDQAVAQATKADAETVKRSAERRMQDLVRETDSKLSYARLEASSRVEDANRERFREEATRLRLQSDLREARQKLANLAGEALSAEEAKTELMVRRAAEEESRARLGVESPRDATPRPQEPAAADVSDDASFASTSQDFVKGASQLKAHGTGPGEAGQQQVVIDREISPEPSRARASSSVHAAERQQRLLTTLHLSSEEKLKAHATARMQDHASQVRAHAADAAAAAAVAAAAAAAARLLLLLLSPLMPYVRTPYSPHPTRVLSLNPPSRAIGYRRHWGYHHALPSSVMQLLASIEDRVTRSECKRQAMDLNLSSTLRATETKLAQSKLALAERRKAAAEEEVRRCLDYDFEGAVASASL